MTQKIEGNLRFLDECETNLKYPQFFGFFGNFKT